jgi:hypothetical protein
LTSLDASNAAVLLVNQKPVYWVLVPFNSSAQLSVDKLFDITPKFERVVDSP